MFHGKGGEDLAREIDRILGEQCIGMILCAAAQLDIVGQLQTPTRVEALAAARVLPIEPLERFLCSLVALGLVERDREGCFLATAAARSVLGAMGTHSSSLRFHGTLLMPALVRLEHAVRSGRPQHQGWPFVGATCAPTPYGELAKHPGQYAEFLAAMDVDGRGDGAALAAILQLRSADRVVDAGCGGGAVARELLRNVAGLRVDSFDLAPAAAIARRASEVAGLSDRHDVRTGDICRRWPFETGSVVLLSGVLSDFEVSSQRTILSRAKEVVGTQGRLAISERLLDDAGTDPPSTAILSLLLLTVTEGAQLRRDALVDLLASCGWAVDDVRLLDANNPKGRSVVVARVV